VNQTAIERPLPNNLDAERSVLGACLLDNAAIPVAGQVIGGEHFFLDQHRRVFNAMQALAATGPVDLVTLSEALHRAGELEAAGGAPYLASLADGMPKVSNVAHYAAIVKEKAILRNVIHACHNIQQRAFEGEDDGILGGAVSTFLAMMSDLGAASMPSTWEEAIMSAMDKTIEAIRYKEAVMRIFCGIPKIDDMTAGFRRKDVVLIVGQTSHGKSLLAGQYAVTSDDAGYKGLIFSAEMSKEALALRELAHSGNVPLYLLRRPEIIRSPDSVIADLTSAAARESKRGLLVVDQDVTPKRIWSLSEMVKKSKGLDFVIVDYDQLVIRAALSGRDDEFKAQARFMAEALALAKRLDICFILLCQPHKLDDDVARGKKPPRVEQIFGSSAAANTAHHILWVVRKFFQTGMDPVYERVAKAYVLKARNDKTGAVDIGFDPDRVLFTNECVELEPKRTKKQAEKAERDRQGEMGL